MAEGRDYIRITHNVLRRTRNSQGILIGTARTNPGKDVSEPAHLKDPKRTAPLKTVYDALVSMGVDALISIGGDDTLKTANKFKLYPGATARRTASTSRWSTCRRRSTTTTSGIDFTFGYFTAVEVLAGEIRNLLADAESNRSYFMAETMGRSAGWLAYGAAIAGEASLVISVEDITGKYEASEEITDPQTGKTTHPPRDGPRRSGQADRGHDAGSRGGRRQGVRRDRDRRGAGRVSAAARTSRACPATSTDTSPSPSSNLSRLFSDLVAKEYTKQTGKKRKITGLQARLRVPLRPAAGLRRDAGQPTGRGGVSGVGREAAGRRDGLGLRPVGA